MSLVKKVVIYQDVIGRTTKVEINGIEIEVSYAAWVQESDGHIPTVYIGFPGVIEVVKEEV